MLRDIVQLLGMIYAIIYANYHERYVILYSFELGFYGARLEVCWLTCFIANIITER